MKRILAGPRAVSEALEAHPSRVAVVYLLDEQRKRFETLADKASQAGVPHERRQREALDALARGQRHQGVLAVAGDYPYVALESIVEQAGERPLLVALDQVQDPRNLGAIVRSAVAFGADGVLTLKDRAAPVTDAVVRASAGATEAARICRITNLARTLGALADAGMQVVGLDASGPDRLESLPFPSEGRVLVVGSEGSGLRRLTRERCQFLAAIPLYGPIASLNASVAAAIGMHESARQRHDR